MQSKKDKLLISITTTKKSNWKKQIKDINKLKIDTVGVFPTGLTGSQRQELYALLDNSCIKKIPHVHIRHDFELKEVVHFIKKYKTKAFTLHYNYRVLTAKWPTSIKKKIFIEANYLGPSVIKDYKKIKEFGGLCIDFSHIWDAKYNYQVAYQSIMDNYKNFKIGCNHLNGFVKSARAGRKFRNVHFLNNKKNLDYLKKMDRSFFSDIICLEMENSVPTQLRYKKYLEKILKNKI